MRLMCVLADKSLNKLRLLGILQERGELGRVMPWGH
jgi:hypothetical protein